MSKTYDDLSKQELIDLLKARDRRDRTRFGLVWEANEIERDRALNQDYVALDFDPALSHGEGPWENLIIEGDNYDALRALKLGFSGRVKCIYIDPPYNTGNKDFVYNDRFVDKNHSWRHSLWCEFMFRRLELAKDLLAQDGVIFVSIDDNEVAHLRLLMDRVFGESNFVASVIWQKVYSPKNSAKHFSADHDFIIAFALDSDSWRPNLLARTEEQDTAYKNPDNDPRGVWKASDLSARNPYSEGIYPITTPSGRVIAGPPSGRYWTVSRSTFDSLYSDNRIWFGKNSDAMPSRKRFLSEVMQGRVPQTLWPYNEVGHNQDGKKEMVAIFPEVPTQEVFSTPKPSKLIERIVQIGCGKDDIVLDFFAGSGTTAHAVAKLNAADAGHRRFILVSSTERTDEQPDKNICRDVCAERVRRVMSGYKDVPALGGSFAYLRTRRIKQGELLDMEHEQIWTALQLLHRERITAYATETLHWLPATDDIDALAYLEHVNRASMGALKKHITEAPAVRLYTWQPGIVKSRLAGAPHVEVLPVPQSLARQFGFKGEVRIP